MWDKHDAVSIATTANWVVEQRKRMTSAPKEARRLHRGDGARVRLWGINKSSPERPDMYRTLGGREKHEPSQSGLMLVCLWAQNVHSKLPFVQSSTHLLCPSVVVFQNILMLTLVSYTDFSTYYLVPCVNWVPIILPDSKLPEGTESPCYVIMYVRWCYMHVELNGGVN